MNLTTTRGHGRAPRTASNVRSLRSPMTAVAAPMLDTDAWMTMADAERYTGLHGNTIRRAIKNGELEASGGGLPGVRIRVRRSALDAWMATRGRGGEGTS